jgi:hypothetical protein
MVFSSCKANASCYRLLSGLTQCQECRLCPEHLCWVRHCQKSDTDDYVIIRKSLDSVLNKRCEQNHRYFRQTAVTNSDGKTSHYRESSKNYNDCFNLPLLHLAPPYPINKQPHIILNDFEHKKTGGTLEVNTFHLQLWFPQITHSHIHLYTLNNGFTEYARIKNSKMFLDKIETAMPIKAQMPTSHCLLTVISVTNTQEHVTALFCNKRWSLRNKKLQFLPTVFHRFPIHS